MINKEKISQIINEEVKNSDIVLVDVKVSASNDIRVVLDSMKGVNIDECVHITRLIESNFNRDDEDYQLEVSSFGLGQPFVLPLQYLKNLNNEVEINLKNGTVIKGILKTVELTENKEELKLIEITVRKKIKEEGKKRKIEVEEIIKVQNSDIQKAKLIPFF